MAASSSPTPGGLPLVRGKGLALALELEDPDVATSAGQGVGAFFAMSGGGEILPRYGIGLGLEWLRPSRSQIDPDPGEPFRFTLGVATALGQSAGIGAAWHHFSGGAPGGADTFDLGLSARRGNRLALGATLRDVHPRTIAGVPVQRRYEIEAAVRPLATDRLELALGGRLGETRLDTDGWFRLSARVAAASPRTRRSRRARHTGSRTRRPAARGGGPRRARHARPRAVVRRRRHRDVRHRPARRPRRPPPARRAARAAAQLAGPGVDAPPPRHIERVELSGEIGVRELTSLVARLRSIARDPTAVAVVVTFEDASGGWATMQELRDELLALRKAGKKVFSYLVSGTGREYLVASAADKIYLDPAGALRLVGMAGTTLYLKGLFGQVGVLPQFERIAEYKSAPEQLIESGPTEPAARMTNELFDSMWEQWLAQVAASRKLGKDELRALIDAGPYTAGDLATSTKLVDAVGLAGEDQRAGGPRARRRAARDATGPRAPRALAAPRNRGHLRRRRHRRRQVAARCRSSACSAPAARPSSGRSQPRARATGSARSSCASTRPAAARSRPS